MNKQVPTIDVPQEPQMALEVRKDQPVSEYETVKAPITAAQGKVDAIANLTMKAYERAATLQITPEEVAKLSADFPDDAFKPGAAGKEALIYIEHAFLRERLNQVFGMGQWAIIPRNRWAEEFVIPATRDKLEVLGSRIYVEAMLVIRGCFVAEAVGEMEYYPKNRSQNYGDAVEGAKTAAFRRCAKELGVGLQAWKKDWCDGWWARKRGKPSAPPVSPVKPANQSQKQPEPAPPAKPATEATKRWMRKELHASEGGPAENIVTEFFMAVGALLPGAETLDDLKLSWVPTTKDKLERLSAAISSFENGDPAVMPYQVLNLPEPQPKTSKAEPEPKEPGDEPWRSFPVPWGKDAGTPLGKLSKNKLFGWWANYVVEREYNGKPRSASDIAKGDQFRMSLDMAGHQYGFTKKDNLGSE